MCVRSGVELSRFFIFSVLAIVQPDCIADFLKVKYRLRQYLLLRLCCNNKKND